MPLRPRRSVRCSLLLLAALLLPVAAQAQSPFRKLGELELRLTGLTASAEPATVTVPKNTASGVRVSISSGATALSSSEAARLLGGSFTVAAEFSGPGLRAPLHLPQQPLTSGDDPFLLNIPAVTQAGDYSLSNLRVVVNGATALDIAPQKIAVNVIDQVLITSVTTRPLTLDEIRAKGIVLDSNAYLGFEFTLGLSLDSKATQFTFPVVFDKRGVAVPQPTLPPMDPERAQMPPLTTIVPMLLKPADNLPEPTVPLPGGGTAEVRIPSVLVIPGNVGYLKQFFSAKLFVANGAPGGTNLTVHDVIGTIKLPAGADQIPNNADDPLTLPDTNKGPQLASLPVRAAGPDGIAGTGDDVATFAPGQQGEAEFLIRGEKEGFHTINFDIEATLDGLVTGPVKVSGTGQGGVLVRNPYFDMTFSAPAVVRNGENFTLFVTVNNISQSLANAVSVTLDASRLAGAHLVGPGTQTADTIAAHDAKTLQFQFQSDRTGQLVATYLNFDTQNGTTGNLKFTLAVGERGVPLSPDTLVLPAATTYVPQSVLNAAMRVLGQAWSVTNAPSGTLPSGVIRTTKEVVTQKALALAEAGLRVSLGEPQNDAVRDLLFDFYGGSPLDPGFDQILRTTSAGTDFARALGAALQTASETSGGATEYERQAAQVAVSGPDFISFAVGNVTGAPVTVSITDAQGRTGTSDINSATLVASDVPSAVVIPFGTTATASRMGVVASPLNGPYKLAMTGTGSATVNVSVTIPTGNGSFIHATASGVAITAGGKYSLGLDPQSALVLQVDADGNGSYESSVPLTSQTIYAQGARLISTNVIGPETLAGAAPFGFHVAALFDRVVDSTSSANVKNYTIAKNSVLSARRQLSGRLVFLQLEQPEGPYVATQMSVANVADGRLIAGTPATVPLRSRLSEIGGVVTGRVLDADGTPIRNAAIVYAQNPELTCAPPLDSIVGLTAVKTDDTGRYELRYVRQDTCGMPFQISTQDPNTGAVRSFNSSVRVAGEQIVIDIAMFGRGAVTGIVKTLTGSPVSGASVLAISQTDPQSSGTAQTDANGRYRIDNLIVGSVAVHAVKGPSLGRSLGRIDRAGTAAIVDLTLDGGTVRATGVVRKVQGSVTSTVPAVQVVYYVRGNDGSFIPVSLATADTNGVYSFDGMPTGEYRIEAALNSRDRGAATGIAAAGDAVAKDIAIVIGGDGYGTVRGIVKFPDGTIAPGVIVSIDNSGVLSNPDGTFELSNIIVKPATSQRIDARSRDGLRAGGTSVLVSQPGQLISNVVIVLSGIGAVEFTVLDTNRNPVSDQEVALLGGCGNPCGCAALKTDSTGKVRFEGLPLGTVTARATRSASNFIDQATASASIMSDGATAFGVMQFSGTGTVTGTVLNPDNSPALGADVSLVAKVFDEDSCSLVDGVAQRVRSDSAGKFRFNAVNVGGISVTAAHPFYTTNVGARGTLAKNGDTADFTLKLVNTISGVLSGNVYLPDGVTTAGPGIEVTAVGPLPDVTVKTDLDGHFTFAKIFPEGTYNLTARDAVSGAVRRDQVYLRASQDVTHDLRLKGRGTVNVRVVNGAGQPVTTSAFVRLQESEYPNRTYETALEAANNGVATFTNVFEGPLTATASDAFARGGRASSVLSAQGATLDMTVSMTTTGTVKGHFFKADGVTPIAFGAVRLISNGYLVGQTTTNGSDDIGAFSFSYVPAGSVRLEGQDPQTARSGVAAGSISTEGETITLDIKSQGLGKVQGLVTSNGAAQPGAQLIIDAGQYHASTITDAGGRYALDGIPEGRVVATASLTGNFLTGTNSGNLDGEANTLTLDVALRDSGKIAGKVLTADGVTVAPLSYITATSGGSTLSTTSDTAGNFAFDRVPTGLATLNASTLGGIDRGAASTDITANNTSSVTVTLNGIGSITGRALDSAGQPIAGDITVTGSGTFPYSFTVQSQADGNFALPQVLAGPFTANLRAKSGEFFLYGTATGNVGPGQTANVSVQVQPSGTVTGVVMRSNGTTFAVGANVTLQLDPNRGTVNLQAGNDGRFTARGVPIGAFTVRINDPITTGLALTHATLANNGDTADLGTIVIDDQPLTVVSVSPANGTTGVATNTPVVVTFSNALSNPGGVSILSGNAAVGASAALSADAKTVTLTGTWPDSKQLAVSVSTATTDIFGRHPLTSTSTTFTTVDLTPPAVSAIVPANGAIQVDPSSALTITFYEPVATPATITLNTSSGAIAGTVAVASPSTLTFTPASPLPINSTFTVSVNGAVDTSGNRQTVAFASSFSTTDTVPPVVAIVSPSTPWVRTARPVIQIGASDATSGVNASAGTLRIDGNAVTASVSGLNLVYTPQADLPDGSHAIASSIPDRAGNVSSVNGSFGIDTVAPTGATVTGITPNQVLHGTVTLTASATDATSGVASIALFADGNQFLTLTAPDFSSPYDTARFAEGAHVLTARATDVAGNVSAAGSSLNVTTDNLPLTVSFTSPAPSQPVRDAVTAVAVATRALSRMEFKLGQTATSTTVSPYTTTFDVTGFGEGSQTMSATAYGLDGQIATASVTFIVDRTPPAPPLTSRVSALSGPNGTAGVFGDPGAVEGNGRVEITVVKSGAIVTVASNVDGSFVATAIPGVAVGDSVSIVAIDAAGNRSLPLNAIVKLNPASPIINWACSTSGAMYPAAYAAKLRVVALGNNQGVATNVVTKVEFFIGASTTPLTGASVSGLTDTYETTMTTSGADGTVIPVRVAVTNTLGYVTESSTSITVVSGNTITADTTIDATNTTYDNQTLIIKSGTTTLIGEHSFARLIVLDGATLTHPRTDTTTTYRLTIGTASRGDVFVSCLGAIDVTARGYSDLVVGVGRTDPGVTGSSPGFGGSHGGSGGGAGVAGQTYGSPFDPNTPGAAGSGPSCTACAGGGGIIRIQAKNLVIDGHIWSNAVAVGGGTSGAGGSIRLDADTLSGGGEIRAEGNGRDSFEAAGGGGRIAVYYGQSTFDRTNITAAGGAHMSGANIGGAGTVYLQQVDGSGNKISDELVIDNRGRVPSANKLPGLPYAGIGTVSALSGGTVALSGPVPVGVEGSSIEFLNASGSIVSRYVIASRLSATSLALKLATGESQANVPVPGTYRAVTKFDQLTVRASGAPLELSGVVDVKTLALSGGAVLTHPYTTATIVNLLKIDADTITIDSTSSIDVTGRGYSDNVSGVGRTYPGTTTGGSGAGSGGSYGGRGGGGSSGAVYGSITDPNASGSAGGGSAGCSACAGGGGILRVTANTIVNNGRIASNGLAAGGTGSGSGGSIRINVGSLSGTGEVRAEGNGRDTFEAAGGGGRVAVYYQSMTFDRTKITAAGGAHSTPSYVGSPGSVYLQQTDSSGNKIAEQLVIDNRNRTSQVATQFAASVSGSTVAVTGSTVTVSGPLPEGIERMYIEFYSAAGNVVSRYQIVSRPSSTTVVVTLNPGESKAAVAIPGTYRVIWQYDDIVMNGNGTFELGPSLKAKSLKLTNGTILTHPANTPTTVNRLFLDVDTLTIDSTSAIDVTGRGYNDSSNGVGHSWNGYTSGSGAGSGGSHGGEGGGSAAGAAYGSAFNPDTPGGSGGASGTCSNCAGGGGIVRIQSRVFTLDGTILSNGIAAGGAGSGAGGSVRIDADTFQGLGQIHADGTGRSTFEAAGGGGRVAVYYTTMLFDRTNITALGGPHSTAGNVGAPGTVYLKSAAQSYGDLIIDNKGAVSTRKTTLTSVGPHTVTGSASSADVAACGEATCVPSQGMYVSHFSQPGCTGTESYYLPYDGFAYACRTWNGSGQCGTIHRTVTNYSARINGGGCQDAWPGGNTLSDFVTIYRTSTQGGGPTDTIKDAAAHFLFPDQLRGVRLFLGTSTTANWPILGNDETSVRVDITSALITPSVGQAFRGLYKLDSLKLRNASVVTTDYVEIATPVDKDTSSTLQTGGPTP